ncbi:MAG TPA: ABC transporter permease [Chryseosolibacter sp.]
MFKNYFKTALRNLQKNQFFTALNVFCLALGMSISLLFVALLSFLFRYDDFHANKDRIYRITTHIRDNDQNPHYASAPVALAQKLKEEVTGIQSVVPIERTLNGEASYLDRRIDVGGYFTGPEFFHVFNFPLLKGDQATALKEPNSIVLTVDEAEKIFDEKDPMGEVIKIEGYGDFVVTGIMKERPKNSHLNFDALASYSTLLAYKGRAFMESEESWTKFMDSYIYILLPESNDVANVQGYLNKVASEKYRKQPTFKASFDLQPLRKIVPGESYKNPIGSQWDILSIILVGATTMIILIPACANYVNLSISQSLKRMKEIGVRKVMGGQRKQIFMQFVMEAILTMLIALILSFFMFQAIRTEFLQVIGSASIVDLAPTFSTVIYFILFAMFVGFIAGITPALYFSKINPVKALKGKPEQARHRLRFPIRKVMITAQFVLSLGFIMSVVIMIEQYRFSVNYDNGFEKDGILDVELRDIDPKIFKNEFSKLAAVEQISMSSHVVGLKYRGEQFVRNMDKSDSIETAAISVDENFFPNLQLKLLAGKSFSDNAAENAQFIIVNEELVKRLGIIELHSAIDKFVVLPSGKAVRIGGVMKNFHHAGLFEQIGGLYFEYDPSQFQYANLRMASTNDRDIAAMEALWKKLGREDKLTWRYFTDEIAEAYDYYFEVIEIWGYLGLLAITVSCVGLLGTVVFTIKNRVKEVSIRKVVGASNKSLVFLLSKDFILLIAIATVITVPTVYFAFSDWLLPTVQHYSKQIGIVEVGLSLTIILTLGLATILSQTLKAANTNPVDNLKAE